jgi:hypothetical protein
MGKIQERSLCGFGPHADLANSATSRGSLRQVYRIRKSNQLSAVVTVHQTASLCEEMRKSLRTCGLLGSSRCLTAIEQVATTHAATAVSGQRRAKC